MRLPLVIVLAFSFTSGQRAQAQPPAEALVQPGQPLESGTRVRLRVEGAKWRLVGRVIAMDDEGIVLKLDRRREPLRVERSEIAGLEISRERRGHAGVGATIGLVTLGPLFAGGAAFAAGVSANGDVGGPCNSSCRAAGAVGFVAGTALSAGIGALIQTEKWRSAERPQVNVSVAPQRRGGLAVGVRFRF